MVGKLFESVLNIRLINLLNVNCLLNSAQVGCRGPGYRPQEHSTVLTEVIKSMVRNHKRTFCAFLDVRKAYSTVLRVAMIEKLHSKFSEAPGGDVSPPDATCGASSTKCMNAVPFE